MSRVCLSLLVLSLCSTAFAADDPPGQVRLSLERYEQLMRDAQNRAGGPQITWGRGELRVTLPGEEERFVTVDLTAVVKIIGGGAARVALLPGDVVIESVTSDGSKAALTRDAGAHILMLPDGDDEVTVRVRYLVPAQPGTAGRTALIPVPALPGSTLFVEAGDRAIDIWPGGRVRKQGSTTVASLPSALAVALRFGDAGGGGLVRRADYELRVGADGEGVNLWARFEVHVKGSKARVRLAPESLALTHVQENDKALVTQVRNGWHTVVVSGAGEHLVVATLRTAVDRTQGQPRVDVALDRAPITKLTAVIPGKRKVTLEPAVPLTTTTTGEGDAQITTATGFLPPSNKVVLTWTEKRPAPEKLVRINTQTYQLVSVQEGVMRSKVQIDYEILRGKTKELAIQIPEGVVLYKVTGDTVEDWRTFAKTDDGQPRQVRITLGNERTGSYRLSLELEQVIPKKEGAALAIPVIRPMSAFRETGVVALFDGKKVGFETAAAIGYTKVGQDALPVAIRSGLERTVSQAWKHIGAPGSVTSKLTEVQAKEVLYDAQVMALYTVKEGAIIANATVQVEVKSGRSERLVLTFPQDVTILAVTAPSLSKKGELKEFDAGEGRKAYELKFSQALEGTIEAHLEFELVPKAKAANIRLPDVRVHGAEVEEGSFGITAETGIEVQQASSAELRKVDVTELPESVSRRAMGGTEILLGYTYAHTPWELKLHVKRHETVQTLKAMITQAWLETTVYEDGHVVTRAVFDVRNDDRQFVRLMLPEGSKVWSVSANGQAIKAVSDEKGAVAIPLRKGTQARVEIVYQATRDALGSLGSLEFLAPRADVVVTDLQWLMRVPMDYALHSISTGMDEADARDYRAPGGAASAMPIPMPQGSDTRMLLYTLAVQEPTEDAVEFSMSYVSRPSEGFGGLLWIVAVVLLLLVVFRRGAGRQMGAIGWLMLLVGLGAGVGKIIGWGIDDMEAWVAIGLLVVASVAGMLMSRKRSKSTEDSSDA